MDLIDIHGRRFPIDEDLLERSQTIKNAKEDCNNSLDELLVPFSIDCDSDLLFKSMKKLADLFVFMKVADFLEINYDLYLETIISSLQDEILFDALNLKSLSNLSQTEKRLLSEIVVRYVTSRKDKNKLFKDTVTSEQFYTVICEGIGVAPGPDPELTFLSRFPYRTVTVINWIKSLISGETVENYYGILLKLGVPMKSLYHVNPEERKAYNVLQNINLITGEKNFSQVECHLSKFYYSRENKITYIETVRFIYEKYEIDLLITDGKEWVVRNLRNYLRTYQEDLYYLDSTGRLCVQRCGKNIISDIKFCKLFVARSRLLLQSYEGDIYEYIFRPHEDFNFEGVIEPRDILTKIADKENKVSLIECSGYSCLFQSENGDLRYFIFSAGESANINNGLKISVKEYGRDLVFTRAKVKDHTHSMFFLFYRSKEEEIVFYVSMSRSGYSLNNICSYDSYEQRFKFHFTEDKILRFFLDENRLYMEDQLISSKTTSLFYGGYVECL